MEQIKLLQTILDHFHVGKILSVKKYKSFTAVETNQGTFIVLASTPLAARNTESKRKRAPEKIYGDLDRQLLRNTLGNLSEEVSYVHKIDKYYSVYKVRDYFENKGFQRILQDEFDKQAERLKDEFMYYAVHTYPGYEIRARDNIQKTIEKMHLKRKIKEIFIPKNNQAIFPGYLIIEMKLTQRAWQCIRNSPGITGFVGKGITPYPLSKREIAKIV